MKGREKAAKGPTMLKDKQQVNATGKELEAVPRGEGRKGQRR